MIKLRLGAFKFLVIQSINQLGSGRRRISVDTKWTAHIICALTDHRSSVLCSPYMARSSLCCQEEAGVGQLRHAARSLPTLGGMDFQTPEGGLLILLSLSYKQVVTFSRTPIPNPRKSNVEIQKMKSHKQFITLGTKAGICQQRHTLIGGCSLSGPSSIAFRSL